MNESQKGTTLTAEELERGRKLLAAIPRDDLGRPYFHLGSTTTPAAVDLVVYLVQHAEDFLSAARRVEELREAVPLVVGGAGTLSVPAIDLIENTAQQLTAANARADAADREIERLSAELDSATTRGRELVDEAERRADAAETKLAEAAVAREESERRQGDGEDHHG